MYFRAVGILNWLSNSRIIAALKTNEDDIDDGLEYPSFHALEIRGAGR